ncbi:hypothetical protein [Natronosalvus rutilus]|uniref:Uncharacterized protein n=1 Tax=Natronosalvus rutilus TaxID=2953753 RepID=A0A9E7SVE9_9EURY|nr:hypothetical protein [Natronosalvus rutilus]UTF53877.1 hypothetical protein NGM29_00920 [Natronosalvus rutilus]
MDLQTFLAATLSAHVGLTIFVTIHAKFTDRELGKWPFVTLALGLAGVAGYFFYDESPEARI